MNGLADIPQFDVAAFFKQDLFTLLGMEDATNQQREKVTRQLLDVVQARVYTYAIQSLNGENRLQAASLPGDEMVPFFIEHDIDIASLLYEESIRYRAELVQLFTVESALQPHFGRKT